MKASRWLRAASVLLALFFLGHTAGILLSRSSGPEEDAVLQAMRAFRFDVMGSNRSIWDFYLGMNLFASLSLAILVVLVWQLANRVRVDSAGLRPLVATLFGGLVLMAVLCWKYFFAAPAGLSTLAAGCAFMAWLSANSSRPV